jgi:hypothetical protein
MKNWNSNLKYAKKPVDFFNMRMLALDVIDGLGVKEKDSLGRWSIFIFSLKNNLFPFHLTRVSCYGCLQYLTWKMTTILMRAQSHLRVKTPRARVCSHGSTRIRTAARRIRALGRRGRPPPLGRSTGPHRTRRRGLPPRLIKKEVQIYLNFR